MRLRRKTIVLSLLCALLAYGACIGWHVLRAWQLYSLEDEIAHTYFPVVRAIYRYAKDQGRPPKLLSDLIPDSLAAIPECWAMDAITYRLHGDGRAWRPEMRSGAYGRQRIYCWQSDHKYTQEEQSRIVLQYHGGWTVLSAE